MALLDDGFAALTDIRVALGAGDHVGCHVFVFSPRTRQRRDAWHRITMADMVAQQLVDSARQALIAIEAHAADEHALAEFDFDALAEGSIGVLSEAAAPPIAEWLDQVPDDDWPVLFAGDEEVLEHARFYVTRLNFPDGRRLSLFRGSRGLNVTLRHRNVVAAAFNRDTHEMIPVEGAVVSFDGNVDFFEWEGLVFIANFLTFESVTNIRELTARKAAEAVDALAGRFQLGDVDGLKAEIGKRTRLAKKLAAAHQHGLVADIDPQRLIQRIAQKRLTVRCDVNGEETRFQIDHRDRQQVEDFVNLMTDFYLSSPVTQREWEAVVKRPPRQRR